MRSQNTSIKKPDQNTTCKEIQLFEFESQSWLILFSLWLKYNSEKENMYCKLCSALKYQNSMARGTDNFRISTLTSHLEHTDHKRALWAAMERRILSPQLKEHIIVSL